MCFNHDSFCKNAGQKFKYPTEETFLDPSALTPLSGHPSRITVGNIIEPSESAKEDVIEGISASSDALKIA